MLTDAIEHTSSSLFPLSDSDVWPVNALRHPVYTTRLQRRVNSQIPIFYIPSPLASSEVTQEDGSAIVASAAAILHLCRLALLPTSSTRRVVFLETRSLDAKAALGGI